MLSRDCYDNHVLGPAELDEEVCSCRTDAKAGSANSVCWQHLNLCEFSQCVCVNAHTPTHTPTHRGNADTRPLSLSQSDF